MENKINIDKHGFVRLVDSMPSQDLDAAIVQAARVSYAKGTTASRSEMGLIRYLLRHYHTTPFEMIEFKFHIKMPIFVARQHMRHRTASINEMSARYSVIPDEFFTPVEFRNQSKTNKQSSDGVIDISTEKAKESCEDAFEVYNDLIENECCRELARCHLPLSTYTEFYWKINLHNLLHYLRLRMEKGAQKEIRDYANAIYDIIKPLVPITIEAFNDFRVNSIMFTGPEVDIIKKLGMIKFDENETKFLSSPGENREFIEKLKKMV